MPTQLLDCQWGPVHILVCNMLRCIWFVDEKKRTIAQELVIISVRPKSSPPPAFPDTGAVSTTYSLHIAMNAMLMLWDVVPFVLQDAAMLCSPHEKLASMQVADNHPSRLQAVERKKEKRR